MICALAGCAGDACGQGPDSHRSFRREHGVGAFVGLHVGVPERVSATLAGAIALTPIGEGYLFAALEPGYGARRRSIGWLLRDPADPLDPWGEHGSGITVRVSQLITNQRVALYRPGRTYYGPELHLIFGAFGARVGAFGGAGPHAARVVVAVGIGAGV